MRQCIRWIGLVLATLVLAACASGPRVVSADVQTNSAQAPTRLQANVHYRFDPAPQRVGQIPVARLQAMAQSALKRVGAVHDDVSPLIGVQVDGSVNATWLDGGGFYGPSNPRVALGLGYGGGWRGGLGLGFGWPMWDDYSYPVYISEVSLLMRDLKTGQIVYDTRARHSGESHDTNTVLAALFVAALEGWPQPPAGVRRVEIPLMPVSKTTTDASGPAMNGSSPLTAPQ